MRKAVVFIMTVCLLLSGCGVNTGTGDVDTGDSDVGNIETEDINAGDIDVETDDISVGDITTGIYVKTEADNIYSVEWKYGSESGSYSEGSDTALETDVYVQIAEEIADVAKREDKSVEFTLTAKKKDGEVFAKGEFTCEAGAKRMELTVMQDGTIQE